MTFAATGFLSFVLTAYPHPSALVFLWRSSVTSVYWDLCCIPGLSAICLQLEVIFLLFFVLVPSIRRIFVFVFVFGFVFTLLAWVCFVILGILDGTVLSSTHWPALF